MSIVVFGRVFLCCPHTAGESVYVNAASFVRNMQIPQLLEWPDLGAISSDVESVTDTIALARLAAE